MMWEGGGLSGAVRGLTWLSSGVGFSAGLHFSGVLCCLPNSYTTQRESKGSFKVVKRSFQMRRLVCSEAESLESR